MKLIFEPPEAWSVVLNIQSYDPKDPVRLLLYPEGSDTYYRMELPGTQTGTGLCVKSARFDAAPYYVKDTDESVARLPNGTYRIEVHKQSHVTATLTGVTVTDTALFPELDGEFLYLPCGELTGDGGIRSDDRGTLAAPANYGKQAQEGTVCDLDGDGWVNQTDLAILTAPGNYGKMDFTVTYPKEQGDNGV